MKKSRVIRKKPSLKTRWVQRPGLKEKSLNLAHPVVKASYTWSVISEQLLDVLGPSLHHRWFKNVKPVVISHNVLILEVPNHFQAQWIHTHYHEVVDLLLSAMDKRLSSFFISQDEKLALKKSESATTEVNRKRENEKSKNATDGDDEFVSVHD